MMRYSTASNKNFFDLYERSKADQKNAPDPHVVEGLFCDAAMERLRSVDEDRQILLKACAGAGVCMTCVLGPPEPYGCTDCLNTGYDHGIDPQSQSKMLEEALATLCDVRCELEVYEKDLTGEQYNDPDLNAVIDKIGKFI